jgi:hypothetical protein
MSLFCQFASFKNQGVRTHLFFYTNCLHVNILLQFGTIAKACKTSEFKMGL